MNERGKLIVAAAAVALLLTIAYRWHMAEMRAALAEQTSKVEADRREETKARYEQRIEELKAEKPKTVAQATQVITRYVPGVVSPVEIRREDFLPAVQEKLPDAPSYVAVPSAEWVKAGEAVIECKKTEAGLTKCEEEKASLEREVETWKRAAKGGSVWQRLGRDALKVGIGIGIGTVIRR